MTAAKKPAKTPAPKKPQADAAAPTKAPAKPAAKAGKPKKGVKEVGAGTRASPWMLKTPSGQSEFVAYRDPALKPPALVVLAGEIELRYHLRCIEDLHAMLVKHGDWLPLGSADENKPAADETVEAWARSPKNPIKGWYGLKKGLRGRFGMYVPQVLEVLGLAEVEHMPRNNRMRAK